MICELSKEDLWAMIRGGHMPNYDMIPNLEKRNFGQWGREWYWEDRAPKDVSEQELWDVYRALNKLTREEAEKFYTD